MLCSPEKRRLVGMVGQCQGISGHDYRFHRVIVGIDNDGHACGVEIGPETEQRCLNEIKVATYPQIMPMISALDEVMIFIKRHINLSYSFDGSLERKERWQYPLEAIRELLLNAVVHRDYQNSSDIVIKIFDDRIIFTNPGRIYGALQIEELQGDDYVSSIRNRLLAECFYATADIERYGSGFIRIRRYLHEYPEVSLKLLEKGDFFWAELCLTPIKTPINNLSELEGKVLNALVVNNAATFEMLARQLGISRNTVIEYIQKLKAKQVIKRVGSRRSGHWVLISESDK